MNTAVGEHATTCPSCEGAFDYRLEVNPGGGFRYEVSCLSCDDVYFDISSLPLVDMPLAA